MLTRRQLMRALVAVSMDGGATAGIASGGSSEIERNGPVDYGATTLPSGIRSRFVSDVNGLTMHVLEAGHEVAERPCVVLLHGFPELAYSWRKVMLPLARAGFHVIAPDQRGYGRTTGWDGRYDGDVGSFRLLNVVRDAVGLVFALGYRSVACIAGHDFGSPVAAWCALLRPDVFRSVALMSAPFPGPPPLSFDTANAPRRGAPAGRSIHEDLAALPRPRKHYQWYFSTREADSDMRDCPQGIHGLSLQERGLDAEQAVPARVVDRSRAREAPHLLRDGPREGDVRDRGARDAFRVRDRGMQMAA
jgi:pimeloyl-ACP methyl ester carboxylesterase